jgi:hypothetical protein
LPQVWPMHVGGCQSAADDAELDGFHATSMLTLRDRRRRARVEADGETVHELIVAARNDDSATTS